MYGAEMGTLAVKLPSGATAWTMGGDQGQGWKSASATIDAASFFFEYTYGGGWQGDAAIDSVTVTCAAPSTTFTFDGASTGACTRLGPEGGASVCSSVREATQRVPRATAPRRLVDGQRQECVHEDVGRHAIFRHRPVLWLRRVRRERPAPARAPDESEGSRPASQQPSTPLIAPQPD